jgi:hypothetical protein
MSNPNPINGVAHVRGHASNTTTKIQMQKRQTVALEIKASVGVTGRRIIALIFWSNGDARFIRD